MEEIQTQDTLMGAKRKINDVKLVTIRKQKLPNLVFILKEKERQVDRGEKRKKTRTSRRKDKRRKEEKGRKKRRSCCVLAGDPNDLLHHSSSKQHSSIPPGCGSPIFSLTGVSYRLQTSVLGGSLLQTTCPLLYHRTSESDPKITRQNQKNGQGINPYPPILGQHLTGLTSTPLTSGREFRVSIMAIS